ncbi:hypothetical protein IOCL2690_000064000 [Leishmania lindenbergi]|uniref:Uncharacterized protein n=1 Tax=Leishmania lindenbergi TaxID=651832 RepID=A0AAW3B0W2_9TRYP
MRDERGQFTCPNPPCELSAADVLGAQPEERGGPPPPWWSCGGKPAAGRDAAWGPGRRRTPATAGQGVSCDLSGRATARATSRKPCSGAWMLWLCVRHCGRGEGAGWGLWEPSLTCPRGLRATPNPAAMSEADAAAPGAAGLPG